jgi:hypothetical protein
MSFASIAEDMTNWIENGGKEGPVEGEHSQTKNTPNLILSGCFLLLEIQGWISDYFFWLFFGRAGFNPIDHLLEFVRAKGARVAATLLYGYQRALFRVAGHNDGSLAAAGHGIGVAV